MFDRVVLINLKRRPDRLTNFRKQQKENGWPLIEPILFEAIDGNKVGVAQYFSSGGGAWGCCRSHVNILERAIMDDVTNLLVLEDDVCWKKDLDVKLKEFITHLPADWDQIMFGGQHMAETKLVADGIVRCHNCQRTHAYAIRGKAMKDLLKLWYKANTHIDHHMGPWQQRYNVYAPTPFLMGQDEGHSDISGNDNSRKFWIPPARDLSIVYLEAPKEVVRQLRAYGLHTGYSRDSNDLDKGLNDIAVGYSLAKMKKWLDVVLWEVASEEGKILAIWHPKIPKDFVQQVYKGPIIHVVGNTVEDCLRQLPQLVNKQTYFDRYVILLRSPRVVMEDLKRYNWHSGYWRDNYTGMDRGLMQIAALPDKTNVLKVWLDCLVREAELLPGGVVTVWHDHIKASDLKSITDKEILEIQADTTEQAIKGFQNAIKSYE